MKLFIIMVLLFLTAKAGTAVPLQLHNRIVFTRDAVASVWNQYTRTVWTMNSEGGDQKQVWQVPRGYGVFGGFTSDGKWAFSYNYYNLYCHDMRTGQILKVSEPGTSGIETISFSPDGKEILCTIGDFSANRDHSKICRIQIEQFIPKMKVRTSYLKPSLLSTGEKLPEHNEWGQACLNKQGNQIVAVSGIDDVNVIYRVRDYGKELWVMNRDGSGAKRLTHNDQSDSMPSFSPDGKTVAFVRIPDAEDGDIGLYTSNIWVYDLVNQSEKPLTFNVFEAWKGVKNIRAETPLFSPDGKYIAFEQKGIYRMNAKGDNKKRLADGYLIQWIW